MNAQPAVLGNYPALLGGGGGYKTNIYMKRYGDGKYLVKILYTDRYMANARKTRVFLAQL